MPLPVASVPAGHPYVERLGLAAVGVALLDDPRPEGAPPGRWWPPAMLDPAWITHHAGRFALVHLHFGFESLSVSELSGVIDALEAAGRPLVHTVHDLDHPQLSDQAHHHAQLDVLLPRADALITLTQGAAREIAERWGRTATVIAHPTMLDPQRPLELDPAPIVASAVDAPRPFRVGIHLRDLRPNMDGPGTVRALAGALARLARDGIDVRGTVWLFDHVRDPEAAARVRSIAAAAARLELVERPRGEDRELVSELLDLDVSLLPYRHGTHSGWAELCWDLGLAMVGRPVGHLADQHDDPDWLTEVDLDDADALCAALGHLVARRPPASGRAATRARRRRRRAAAAPAIAAAHRAVYDAVLA